MESTANRTLRWLGSCIVPVLILCSSGFAQTTPKSLAAKPRVTQALVEAERTTLKGTTRIAAMASADGGAVSDSQALQQMILLLKPSDTQEQALKTLVAQQYDSSSPNYHQWLTPAEYGVRFGIANADLQVITTWLQSHGLSVEEISASKSVILFSGTHAQFQEAFHTSLHTYTVNGEKLVANSSNPQIPTAIAGVIKGVVSLNSIRKVGAHHDFGQVYLDKATHAVTLPETSTALSANTSVRATAELAANPSFTYQNSSKTTYHAVTPYDLAAIYNLKPLWNSGIDGTGQQIAIIGRSRVRTADVDYFRSEFGLPATKMNTVIAGTSDPGYSSDESENALDVQWSGAVARNATINLVVAASTYTTDGVDIAALYAVNNNIAPVLNVSYGQCEASLGESGNAFYYYLWQQAAAQGQSVFISTGDAGAATCDQGSSYASNGLAVNGLASTPYNVAVGGTDFYGNYINGTSNYWSSSNDSNMASALSYIPESPWDDSCANPLVQQALVKAGYAGATPGLMCNNTSIRSTAYFTVAGGGGGISNCLGTTDGTVSTCSGAWERPSWQTGVTGLPNNAVRNLPDVSLFAADGVFGSFYIYCQSDVTASGSCDLSTLSNLQGAGGTSFASPAFAGIMALVNQQAAAAQGNPNPIFYKMAANQYSSGLSCSSSTSIPSGSCIFHDVDLGSNAVVCYKNTANCTRPSTTSTWGTTDGYAAGTGYDLTTGLGSVDIYNLVNGWSSVTSTLAASTTTLALTGSTTANYGVGIAGSVTVAPTATNAAVPTGDVALMTTSSAADMATEETVTLSSGKASVALKQLPAGSYSIYARYAGDENFAASKSAYVSVTVNKAATTIALTSSRSSLAAGQSTTITAAISATGSGLPPTGTLTLTNSTTGATLGSVTLTESASALSQAILSIPASALQGGTNKIVATYAGDSNYIASTGMASLVLSAPYALTLSSSSLNIGATAGSSAQTTLTVSGANSGSATWPISLSCSGALPAGATCKVSTSVLASGATSAVVTVAYSPVVAANRANPVGGGALSTTMALGLACIFCGGLYRSRKRWVVLLPVALLAVISISFVGCGGRSRTLALVLTPSASSISSGDSLQLSAVLSGGDKLPTGTISFIDAVSGASTTLTSATISNGAASYTLTPSIGSHTYHAVYSGDSQYDAIDSALTAVSVSYSTTLQINATDANGYTVTAPLAVTIK